MRNGRQGSSTDATIRTTRLRGVSVVVEGAVAGCDRSAFGLQVNIHHLEQSVFREFRVFAAVVEGLQGFVPGTESTTRVSSTSTPL